MTPWPTLHETTVPGRRKRRLNPRYILTMMERTFQREADLCCFFAPHFGVEDVPQTRLWNEPCGNLRCLKCGNQLEGTPREILIGNSCLSCAQPLYDINDSESLDFHGFDLYRNRVNELTDLAEKVFRHMIQGTETGAHRDHILSVRDGFEHGAPEQIVASPVNLQRLPATENMKKHRKSAMQIDDLITRYEIFVTDNPAWLALVDWMEVERANYVPRANRRFDDDKALAKYLRDKGYQVVER